MSQGIACAMTVDQRAEARTWTSNQNHSLRCGVLKLSKNEHQAHLLDDSDERVNRKFSDTSILGTETAMMIYELRA